MKTRLRVQTLFCSCQALHDTFSVFGEIRSCKVASRS